MKITIDEDVCRKNGLELSDLFAILYVRCTDNVEKHKEYIANNEIIVNRDNQYFIDASYSELVDSILLTSDKSIPEKLDCEKLAIDMRQLFPKGIKTGSSAWRGNLREITLRLQKFFKLYGSDWTEEQILAATKRYIESFNGDTKFMRILKYFILKSEKKFNEEGKFVVEEVSELATWLENDDLEKEDTLWQSELK